MHSLWFFQALGAAMCWGLSYTLTERVLGAGVSPLFLIAMSACLSLPIYLALMLGLGGTAEVQRNLSILAGDQRILAYAVASTLIIVFGVYLIYGAIAGKNATLASFVEITFPLFTLLFAWALFREVQIGPVQALGGALILAGVGLIYWRG